MREPWADIDRAIAESIEDFGRARERLRREPQPVGPDPRPPRLAPSRLAALRHADSAAAAPRLAWLSALEQALARWPTEIAAGALWHTPHAIDGASAAMTPMALRAGLLSAPAASQRRERAHGLLAVGGTLHAHALAATLAATSHGRGALPAEQPRAEVLRRAAGQWLALTDDAAAEWQRRGWVEGLGAAVGRSATDGWPPRASRWWLSSVFRGTGMLAGGAMRWPNPPATWGSSSFARALGAVGEAVLAAARPPAVPVACHQLPFSVRRHQRAALFGAITLLEPFARRVLGLSRARAREQRRSMAAATLASLRLDAVRVVLWAAAARGAGPLREQHQESTTQLFGGPAPMVTLAVLPQLHPIDGARFAGAMRAARQLSQLIERHDEDWFRNPRVAPALRAEDERAVIAETATEVELGTDVELAAELLTRLVE